MRRERRGGASSRGAVPTRRLGGALHSLRRFAVETWQGEGWHEPYESRGSHTDLWETGGAIPPVDPAKQYRTNSKLSSMGSVYGARV